MKTNYAFFVLLCVAVLFVSMAVAATEVTTQDKPMDGKIEAELASGRCIHGCCNRHFYGACRVCCASAEEAKAAAVLPRGGFSVHGRGYAATGEVTEKEAKP